MRGILLGPVAARILDGGQMRNRSDGPLREQWDTRFGAGLPDDARTFVEREPPRAEGRLVGGVGVHEQRRCIDAVVIWMVRQIHKDVAELVGKRAAALSHAD